MLLLDAILDSDCLNDTDNVFLNKWTLLL
jgi:hypothetical protein